MVGVLKHRFSLRYCVKHFMVTAEHVTRVSFSSTPVDVNNRDMMLNIINSSITTKVISRWSSLACNIALDAVKTVQFEENGRKEIDIKKYARVEKVSCPVQCVPESEPSGIVTPLQRRGLSLVGTRKENWTD